MDLSVTTQAEGDLLGCDSLILQDKILDVETLTESVQFMESDSTAQTTKFFGTLAINGGLNVQDVLVDTLTSPTGTLTLPQDVTLDCQSLTTTDSVTASGKVSFLKSNMGNNTSIQLVVGKSLASNDSGFLRYQHVADGNAANEIQMGVNNYPKLLSITSTEVNFPESAAINGTAIYATVSLAPSTITFPTATPTLSNALAFSGQTYHSEFTINFDMTTSGVAGTIALQVGTTTGFTDTLYEGSTAGHYRYNAATSVDAYQKWAGTGIQLCTDKLDPGKQLTGTVRFYRMSPSKGTNLYVCWVQASCPDTGAVTAGYAKTMDALGMGSVTLATLQQIRLICSTGTQVASTSTWNCIFS